MKIIDEPEIDVSLSAWSITFDKAKHDIQTIILDNIKIPYLGIESLIQSKTTNREQDIWDVQVLNEIKKSRNL